MIKAKGQIQIKGFSRRGYRDHSPVNRYYRVELMFIRLVGLENRPCKSFSPEIQPSPHPLQNKHLSFSRYRAFESNVLEFLLMFCPVPTLFFHQPCLLSPCLPSIRHFVGTSFFLRRVLVCIFKFYSPRTTKQFSAIPVSDIETALLKRRTQCTSIL